MFSPLVVKEHSFLVHEVLASQLGREFASSAHTSPLSRQGRMSACYFVTTGRQPWGGDGRAEDGVVVKLREMADHGAAARGATNTLSKSAAIARALTGAALVPRILAFGITTHPISGETYEFSIEEYIAGKTPIAVGARARLQLFTSISSQLKEIYQVKFSGFGDEVSLTESRRFHASSWTQWRDELLRRARFRELGLSGFLSKSTAELLDHQVRKALTFRTSPTLYHGDLLGNWSNVVVGNDGRVNSLLDWEFSGAGAALEQEIASVLYCFHRDQVPLAEREIYFKAILDGFGVGAEEYCEVLRPRVDAFLSLHAAKAINRLFPQPGQEKLVGADRAMRLKFAHRARTLLEHIIARR